ncbi:MAG: efflux RND transporter periplasmic adaptor subunit [Phycisphaerales bacterium]
MRTVRMLLAAATAAVALMTASCGPGHGAAAAGKQERPVEPVELAPVKHLPVTQWVDVSGTLEANERIQVSAKVAGRVVTVEHDLGDRVQDGAVLAKIDDADYQIVLSQKRLALAETLAELGLTEPPPAGFDVGTVPRVRAVRAQAANAAAKRDRIATLVRNDPAAFSTQDFEDIKTAADVAAANAEVAALEARTLVATAATRQADVAKVQRDLEEAVIHAPTPTRVGGKGGGFGVAIRAVAVGDLLAVGSTAFTLVEDDPLKFTARVPERFAAKVAQGQRVEVNVEAREGSARGEVRRVSPIVDAESRMLNVQIELPNESRVLKPGLFTRGRIAVGERAEALFVPAGALVTFAGVKKVFTVKDGKAVEHLVETGERRDGMIEITAGLDGEETVVVKGAGRLTRGRRSLRVRPLRRPRRQADAHPSPACTVRPRHVSAHNLQACAVSTMHVCVSIALHSFAQSVQISAHVLQSWAMCGDRREKTSGGFANIGAVLKRRDVMGVRRFAARVQAHRHRAQAESRAILAGLQSFAQLICRRSGRQWARPRRVSGQCWPVFPSCARELIPRRVRLAGLFVLAVH